MLTLRVLSNRPIAILWSGLVFSAIGDEFFRIALIWLSVSKFGPHAGLLPAMQAAASVGAGLFGGVLVDKFKHRHTMIGTDLLRGLLVLLLPVLSALDHLSFAALAVITVLVAGLGAFFDPALQACLPVLTSEARLLQATNGLFDATRRIARIVGPGLVGVMQVLVPIIHFFTLDAISFLFSLGAVIGISGTLRKSDAIEAEHVPQRVGFIDQMRSSFVALRGDGFMQYMLLGHGAVNGAFYIGLVLSTALRVNQEMPDAIGLYGLIIASYGVGNVGANFVAGNMEVRRPVALLMWGRFIAAAGFIVLGLSSAHWAMLLGAGLAGVGAPLANMPFLIRLQGNYAGRDIARLFRLRLVSESGFVLVSLLLSPLLYRLVSPATSILDCGIVIALVGAAAGLVTKEQLPASTTTS